MARSDSENSSHNSESTLSDDQDANLRKYNTLKYISFAFLWIIVFALEFLYRDALFDLSITLQTELQPNIDDSGLFFSRVLSLWGDGVPYFLTVILIFNYDEKERAFYYVLFISAVGFLMNTTKMAYHEPRPFMETSKIHAYGCSAEYGNPSGHSLFAAGFNFFFFFEVTANWRKKKQACQYYLLLILAILLTFFIGFSRYYLGQHTINQIFYGWQLGLLLAFFFHYGLRDIVLRHIRYIIKTRKDKLPYSRYIVFREAPLGPNKTNVLQDLTSFGVSISTFLRLYCTQKNIQHQTEIKITSLFGPCDRLKGLGLSKSLKFNGIQERLMLWVEMLYFDQDQQSLSGHHKQSSSVLLHKCLCVLAFSTLLAGLSFAIQLATYELIIQQSDFTKFQFNLDGHRPRPR